MIKLGETVYRLHPLFVLLMLSSVLTGYFVEMLTLFGVVTIHELGHVACAKAFGWRVRRVQLLPFGGVAEVEESTNVPAKEEIIVACCGPLQNVWMAGFAFLMMRTGWGDTAYWEYFYHSNVLIGAFNLLPALPLDGGKIMMGLLSYGVSYHRALTTSLYVSTGLAGSMVLFAAVSYLGQGIQLNLLVIGIFLFYSNWYALKQLPYQFLRFLINREQRTLRMANAGRKPSPLLVSSQDQPLQVLRQFRREEHHLLYIVGPTGAVLQIRPETSVLRAYLSRIGPPASRYRRPWPIFGRNQKIG